MIDLREVARMLRATQDSRFEAIALELATLVDEGAQVAQVRRAVPARELADIYWTRLRLHESRGVQVTGLADAVNVMNEYGNEKLSIIMVMRGGGGGLVFQSEAGLIVACSLLPNVSDRAQ